MPMYIMVVCAIHSKPDWMRRKKKACLREQAFLVLKIQQPPPDPEGSV